MKLAGKTIVLGVTGGIAAYKACELASALKKLGADVIVVMTHNACKFVAPLTFETLTNNKVIKENFDENRRWEVEHIALTKRADMFVVAPCTANVVGKLAAGIADDFLTTTLMAFTKPVLIAPAMNTNMILSAAYQDNQALLQKRGYYFINSEEGMLACGDKGLGRLASIDKIVERVLEIMLPVQDLSGKQVVVSAGATREYLDPVRYITNRCSGKMGLALAKAAAIRGADVTLVAGHITERVEQGYKVVSVSTTTQMHKAVMSLLDADYIIMAAAPCDYKTVFSENKIKSDTLELKLEKNPDIAADIGKNKKGTKLIIFAAETQNLEKNARAKLISKNADMVIANDVSKEGAGFDTDTNIVTIITKDSSLSLEKMPKSQLAHIILDKMLCLSK